jgi:hypothetical protein
MDAILKDTFQDQGDNFVNTTPGSTWKEQLEHAQLIGMGSREYELIFMK